MSKKKPKPAPASEPRQGLGSPHGKREKKSSLKVKIRNVLIFISVSLAGSCGLELLAHRLGVYLIFPAVLSFIGSLITAFKGEILKPNAKDEKPKEEDSLMERLAMGLRNILRRIKDNAIYTLIFVVTFYICTCTVLAVNHTVGRMLNTAQEIIDQLTDYEEQPDESAGIIDEPSTIPSDPAETLEEDGPEPAPEQTVPIPGTYVAVTEPNRYRTLSEERSGELYYFSGEYAVEEYEDDGDIYAKVSLYISSLVSQNQEDKFSQTKSTDPVRAIAYSASTGEASMKTTDDLDDVISKREVVYDKAPGAEIARLIAENYNGYGLAYHSINGYEETVESYWADSIEWFHKSLTFSNSGEEISKILNRIGMRYHDLADGQASREKETNKERAGKLSEAYFTLAKYYRQESTE